MSMLRRGAFNRDFKMLEHKVWITGFAYCFGLAVALRFKDRVAIQN